MNHDEFWRLIEQARPPDNDPDRHCQATWDLLMMLEPEQIVSFGHTFFAIRHEAYRADLWSVISRIDGLCGDDGFMDFRAWLVMQGHDVFETVLGSPDYLGEITLQDCEMSYEPFNYMAGRVYEKKMGHEIPYEPAPSGTFDRFGRLRLKGRFIKSEQVFRRRWPVLWMLLNKPPAIDPNWLMWHDSLVRTMAQTIEKKRSWSDLPVLADALEEAGCSERLILDHCRAGTRHARTCWVVNFLLGREQPRPLFR